MFARVPLLRALHVATFNGERDWEVESGRGPGEEGTAESWVLVDSRPALPQVALWSPNTFWGCPSHAEPLAHSGL